MSFFAWLIQAVGPVTARILASLGLSLVSMTGLGLSMAALKAYVIDGVSSFPTDSVQLLGLFGAWECIGLMLGTMTFVITWQTTSGAVWRLAKS